MNNKKILIEIFIMILLFLGSNILGGTLGIITFLFIGVCILANKNKENLCILYFLLPNIRILDIIGDTYYINLLILLISIKYFFLEEKNKKKVYIRSIKLKYITCFYLIFFMEILHYIITASISFIDAINIAFDFMMCIYIISSNTSKNEFKMISQFLLLGVLNSAIVYIAVNPNTINMIFLSKYRLSAYGNDPNYLSMYIILGISGLLNNMYESRAEIKTIILILGTIIIGLLTASKLFFICLVSLFFIYFIILLKDGKFKKIIGIIYKGFPFLLLVVLVYREKLSYLINKVIERFGSSSINNMAEFTTGRSIIISQYIKYINESIISILFGRGIGYLNYYKSYGMEFVAHNTYMDFILSWGIVGFVFFIIIFFFNIKNEISLKGKKVIDLITIMYTMIMIISLSCMSSDMFWYILAYSLMPLKVYKENDAYIGIKK